VASKNNRLPQNRTVPGCAIGEILGLVLGTALRQWAVAVTAMRVRPGGRPGGGPRQGRCMESSVISPAEAKGLGRPRAYAG